MSVGGGDTAKSVRRLSVLWGVLILLLEGVLVYTGKDHLAYSTPSMVVPPLLILGSSVFLTGLFWMRVWLATPTLGRGWRRFFSPAYGAIRDSLRERRYAGVALASTCLYALLFMLAEGAIKREPAGVRAEVLWEGLPGFTPQVALFPWPDLGVRLNAYQMGALLFLSSLFGVNIALLVRLYAMQGKFLFRSKGLAPGLGGAATGLLITCPSCATTPMAALVSAFLLPAGTLLQRAVGTMLVYLVSVLLVSLGVSLSSQAVEQGRYCRLPFGDKPS